MDVSLLSLLHYYSTIGDGVTAGEKKSGEGFKILITVTFVNFHILKLLVPSYTIFIVYIIIIIIIVCMYVFV